MDEFSLTALGTHWTLLVDGTTFSESVKTALTAEIQRFEDTYSRFKPESLLSQLNAQDSDQPLPISEELATMLKFGLQVSQDTDGLFDPNVASWESAYGYNQDYDFKNTRSVVLPDKGWFELQNQNLVKHGLVQLDLGAFGKGFLIDLLAKILKKEKYEHFLIDGGRDFWGTLKADGSAWQIALEHPTDASLAVGVTEIKNQGFAASNSFHRRVGNFHHLLNGQTGEPAAELASVFVIADTAMEADGISTALFVSPPNFWPKLQAHFQFEYLTVTQNLKMHISDGFPGKVFLE